MNGASFPLLIFFLIFVPRTLIINGGRPFQRALSDNSKLGPGRPSVSALFIHNLQLESNVLLQVILSR